MTNRAIAGKEILVDAPTEHEALRKVCNAFADFIRDEDIKNWIWRKPPETQKHKGKWQAYGRISYSK